MSQRLGRTWRLYGIRWLFGRVRARASTFPRGAICESSARGKTGSEAIHANQRRYLVVPARERPYIWSKSEGQRRGGNYGDAVSAQNPSCTRHATCDALPSRNKPGRRGLHVLTERQFFYHELPRVACARKGSFTTITSTVAL